MAAPDLHWLSYLDDIAALDEASARFVAELVARVLGRRPSRPTVEQRAPVASVRAAWRIAPARTREAIDDLAGAVRDLLTIAQADPTRHARPTGAPGAPGARRPLTLAGSIELRGTLERLERLATVDPDTAAVVARLARGALASSTGADPGAVALLPCAHLRDDDRLAALHPVWAQSNQHTRDAITDAIAAALELADDHPSPEADAATTAAQALPREDSTTCPRL